MSQSLVSLVRWHEFHEMISSHDWQLSPEMLLKHATCTVTSTEQVEQASDNTAALEQRCKTAPNVSICSPLDADDTL